MGFVLEVIFLPLVSRGFALLGAWYCFGYLAVEVSVLGGFSFFILLGLCCVVWGMDCRNSYERVET